MSICYLWSRMSWSTWKSSYRDLTDPQSIKPIPSLGFGALASLTKCWVSAGNHWGRPGL